MAKKMTVEEYNEFLRKDGRLDESLSIFPDDKYDAIASMRIAQAALQPEEQAEGEEIEGRGRPDSTAA